MLLRQRFFTKNVELILSKDYFWRIGAQIFWVILLAIIWAKIKKKQELILIFFKTHTIKSNSFENDGITQN